MWFDFFIRSNKNQFETKFTQFIDKQIQNDFIPNNYTFFKSSNEIKKWGKEYIEYFKKKEFDYKNDIYSNDREITQPFAVFSWYCGYFYDKINGYLRGNIEYEDNNFITKRIDIILCEMAKFELKTNIISIRRISNHFFDNYLLEKRKPKKGVIYKDGGFTSTSLDLSYRKDIESNYKTIQEETILILKIQKGTKAIYLEPISKREEYELLLINELNFEIEIEKKIGKSRIIVAKSILIK